MDGPLPSIARSTHQHPPAPTSTHQHPPAPSSTRHPPADLDAASCAINVANIEEHAPQGKAERKLEETKVGASRGHRSGYLDRADASPLQHREAGFLADMSSKTFRDAIPSIENACAPVRPAELMGIRHALCLAASCEVFGLRALFGRCDVCAHGRERLRWSELLDALANCHHRSCQLLMLLPVTS